MMMEASLSEGPQKAWLEDDSYSCLISVYEKDDPLYLAESLDSILGQTIPPSEIVMVKDGVLPIVLEEVLVRYDWENPGLFTFVSYGENRGLWFALDEGLRACSNELVMRMDADDRAMPERASRQLEAFGIDPALDCVGSVVVEFEGERQVALVSLPENNEDILVFGRKRCPFRHSSLMYRKSTVLRVGGYREMPYFEDYDLFMRLASQGATFRNLQNPLVHMRVSPDFYARRGGVRYLANMFRFKVNCLREGYYGLGDFIKTTVPHGLVCLMPNGLRSYVYTHFLRASIEK